MLTEIDETQSIVYGFCKVNRPFNSKVTAGNSISVLSRNKCSCFIKKNKIKYVDTMAASVLILSFRSYSNFSQIMVSWASFWGCQVDPSIIKYLHQVSLTLVNFCVPLSV